MAELGAALILIGVCFVIGMRLLFLWRRTQALPEFLIGSSFLLAGTAAGAFGLLRSLAPVQDLTRLWLANASVFVLHGGVVCLAAFTWRVFRPEDGLGRALFALVTLGLSLGLIGEVTTQQPAAGGPAGAWGLFSLAVRVVAYGWAASECFAYWRRLRRRAALGFGDPLVASRMLLWGLGNLAIVVLWTRLIALSLAGAESADSVGSVVATGLVVLCTAAYWMAFFPPASWRRWIAAA